MTEGDPTNPTPLYGACLRTHELLCTVQSKAGGDNTANRVTMAPSERACSNATRPFRPRVLHQSRWHRLDGHVLMPFNAAATRGTADRVLRVLSWAVVGAGSGRAAVLLPALPSAGARCAGPLSTHASSNGELKCRPIAAVEWSMSRHVS